MAVDIDGVNSTVSTATISTDKLIPQSGTALQIGESSDVITIPSGATITNSGTANGFGGGKVLQVVSYTKKDVFSTTTASYVDTGLEVSITPASGTKVLVLVNFSMGMPTSYYGWSRLVRDSTDICIADADGVRPRATWNNNQSEWQLVTYEMGINHLDTHGADGSTAVAYKVQFNSHDSGAMKMNASADDSNNANSGCRAVSAITAMEIGA